MEEKEIDRQGARDIIEDHGYGAPIRDQYSILRSAFVPWCAIPRRCFIEATRQGKSVLFEGAQGTMLDIDHGTYPFVTSSSASAGGACTGAGVPPTSISGVIGVSKAYITRVGGGPFPTEALDATGRPDPQSRQRVRLGHRTARRCGWFDVPLLRYTAMINGFDSLVITKLDVLDELEKMPVCNAYRLGRTQVTEMPATIKGLQEIEPVYECLPGWQVPTAGTTSYEQLPARPRDYLRYLEELTGVEIGCVSTGPERNQTMVIAGSRFQQLVQ